MQRILTSLFALSLFGLALAAPPADYELTCVPGDVEADVVLLGVLSVTEDGVKVALVDGVVCTEPDVIVVSPDGAVDVEIVWGDEDPVVTVYLIDGETESLYEGELVVDVVPLVAVEGMQGAHHNRAAAMERREAAQEERTVGLERAREVAGERAQGRPFQDGGDDDIDDVDDDLDQEVEGAGEAGGPPAGVPRGRP